MQRCVVRLEDVSETDGECGQKCGQASSVVWGRALCNNEMPRLEINEMRMRSDKEGYDPE